VTTFGDREAQDKIHGNAMKNTRNLKTAGRVFRGYYTVKAGASGARLNGYSHIVTNTIPPETITLQQRV